jgi:two-component system response regulator (stage 0 sporulation protein A)
VSLTNILHELGVPSNIKGYQYIKESILLLYDNPCLKNAITKELYPKVAYIFSTTISCVERSIRHAIDVSWNRGNLEFIDEVFGHSLDIEKCKPTNSEFLITIADLLIMRYYDDIEV